MKSLFSCVLSFFASTSAMAAPLAQEFFALDELTPSPTIAPGRYGTAHSRLDGFRIDRWATMYIATGSINYGQYRLPFQAPMTVDPDPAQNNTFHGTGQLKDKFGNTFCYYDFAVDVISYKDDDGKNALYIRYNAPGSAYTSWNVEENGCPGPASPNTWVYETEAYTLQ